MTDDVGAPPPPLLLLLLLLVVVVVLAHAYDSCHVTSVTKGVN